MWPLMTIFKSLIRASFFFFAIFLASQASATTYYVDYTNGSDSNNGTSKSSPWKTAPGMQGNAGVSANTTLNPGDSVIFKGCVTWPNAVWNWTPKFSGTSGNPIYYGVDQTWWDSSVTGCATAWNRPIFDPGGAEYPNQASDPRMVYIGAHPYQTLDNFEFRGYYADGAGSPITHDYVDFGDGGNPGLVVENCYFHGWKSPFFSIGTGNVAANSNTITNYVPYSYSNSPAPSWASAGRGTMQAQVYGYWPVQNNGPTVNSITSTGGNTWTVTTNSSALSSPCKGCIVQIGEDFMAITGGVENVCSGCMMLSNVIDGSDTEISQLNPYADCGLSEGNNNWCGSSGTVGWRLPNIWRNNVIRYVNNGMVGECSEYSNNLIEYIRNSPNPTSHTNVIECLDDAPIHGVTLFYNNTIRHTTNPNPHTPTGRWSVGVGAWWITARAGETVYLFNNVMYDILQNDILERASSSGTWKVFNNSANCGPQWSLSYQCGQVRAGDTYQNNHFITTNSSPIQNNCSGATCSNNLFQTPSAAKSSGFEETQTFAFAPVSSGSRTVGKGARVGSFCTAIGSAGFSDAANACQKDTSYGVGYNAATHTVIWPNRTTVSRPVTPDIGAYQFSGSSGSGSTEPPAPQSGLAVAATTN